MQYELFSDADFQQEKPFAGRSFCLAGSFHTASKALQQCLVALGAEIKQGLSRNVHYAVLGRDVSTDDKQRLLLLEYNGYKPRVLTENELESILQGHYSSYIVPEKISKDLHLTLQHYLNARMSYEGSMNPLYMKELYIAPETETPQAELYQMLGNRGIYANAYIDDTTDVIVIGNNSLRHLEEGASDKNLRYIEEQYNRSRAQTFRYVMTSEAELLTWLNKQ